MRNEQINYDPFFGISDLHLVCKAVPISFELLKKTINEMVPELWSLIEASASGLSAELGEISAPKDMLKGLPKGWSRSGKR